VTHPLRNFLLLLLIGAVTVTGCDLYGDDVRDAAQDRLDRARQKWQDQGITDYQFMYSQQRGETIVDTAQVFVQSGQVDSIATTPEVPEDELLVGTVESFFELIEGRIKDDNRFGANFDQEFGYPTDYNADFEGDRRSEDIITLELGETANSDS